MKILPRGDIKSSPDTFVVQEVVGSPPELVPLADETSIRGWDRHSSVTIFELTKSGWSTEDALREVARQLRTSFEFVKSTGLKDKHALTSQRIAVRGMFHPFFRHRQMFLRQVEGASRLERHQANHFNILIISDADSIDIGPARCFPNFFGPQRLGQPNSEQVGRLLFEGQYEKAAVIAMQTPSRRTLESAASANGCSLAEALFSPVFRFALRFELEKWQSFLWNELLRQLVARDGVSGLPERLPMWSSDSDVIRLYQHIWNPERVRSMEWALRLAGPFSRPTIIKPNGLHAERKPAGWEINFDLPPGCYATVLLAQVFELEERHL